MSKVFIHIQSGGKKGTFLRGVADDGSEEAVVAAVKAMLANPDACNLSNVKPKKTFAGHKPAKRLAAMRGDEEAQIPGVIDDAIDRATSPR